MEATSESISRLLTGGSAEEYLQCPTCECKLQHWEVKPHFDQEMERLKQLQMKAVSEATVELTQQSASNTVVHNEERRKPWTIFQRVQRNRHTRLRRRTGKRPPPPTEQQCPVCNASFPLEEIEQHAEQCLRRTNGAVNGPDGGSSSNEDENGEEYEEYEWAGQKRIRVSSLLQGGYAAIGVGQSVTNHSAGSVPNNTQIGDEEEEDLNVDEDDTHLYGPAQYAEADVIPPIAEENGNSADGDVTSYMRRLITGSTETTLMSANATELQRAINSTNTLAANIELSIPRADLTADLVSKEKQELTSHTVAQQYSSQIIESLKSKLRHYENQVQNKFKCLICLDDYRNPAISVACWHVHCEECWLRSLGARKLCPQCNLITTPKDLRRIYM
ncbi:E3 ubiquitin-protein ligase RNF220-like [Rhagoletis pomonella]|uniref:E3 ubiquitin-protein ligase RNF220-like n=1 Tax=Rhagoletis pomonella TaxID=28610 RepID=UPI00177F10A7|nr:E3 ubiquitin-protein ligase RNF220-like [Rhagoletis pomonella]XP_036342023.1 E3 ubiquitin-protein ligase RNF220-like [Rhagoletis pomonella]